MTVGQIYEHDLLVMTNTSGQNAEWGRGWEGGGTMVRPAQAQDNTWWLGHYSHVMYVQL